MLLGLNYDKDDLKFILFGKVFKFSENEKFIDEYNRWGIIIAVYFSFALKYFLCMHFLVIQYPELLMS